MVKTPANHQILVISLLLKNFETYVHKGALNFKIFLIPRNSSKSNVKLYCNNTFLEFKTINN